ncbi:MAG TPA: AMP-binding protein [Blastocatellia bacterium]|nr:AMP-binding protein [Blastocatellia bacterium]HMV86243.1 AMP-binding protein [Blastocatellia bacterium]HMZ19056.1 AMP-binding protein [Blastocatellia bacterium]HNG30146.1 AMP-binding protein [Blastocatellia bacterium]
MAIKDNLAHWHAEEFGIGLIDLTVGDLLDQRAAELPDKEALVYNYPEFGLNLRLTYRQYRDTVNQLAKGLMALGIEKGDHVAVWATNLPEWVFLEMALAKIGGVLVTVNTNYRAAEIEYVLRQGDIKALFLIEELRGNSYLESVYSAAPELKTLSDPVNQELQSEKLPRLKRVVLIGKEARPGVMLHSQVLALADQISNEALLARQHSVTAHDVAQIQFTSGTTGFPKGVMLTHHNLINQSHVATTRGDLRATERYVTAMPFFHIAGSLGGIIYATFLGCTLIPLIAFDPVKHLELFDKEKGSFTFAVPTMLVAMLNHPRFAEFDLSSLRSIFTGATPVPMVLMEQIKARIGADCSIVFGMTETCGAVTQSFYTDSFEMKAATVGLPIPHTSIKIVNPATGETCRCGESGELWSQGFSNMAGYYNMPDKTAETLDDDGWLHSGDLAVMRADGYINIVGRVKDMIIRGGENIYPAEIEAFLMRHPSIAEAQIVGIPDAFMGEEVCALLRLKPGESLTEDELREHCKANIARHKVPKHFRFVEAFPLTASGKVQKFVLREQLIQEMGLEDVAELKTA